MNRDIQKKKRIVTAKRLGRFAIKHPLRCIETGHSLRRLKDSIPEHGFVLVTTITCNRRIQIGQLRAEVRRLRRHLSKIGADMGGFHFVYSPSGASAADAAKLRGSAGRAGPLQ